MSARSMLVGVALLLTLLLAVGNASTTPPDEEATLSKPSLPRQRLSLSLHSSLPRQGSMLLTKRPSPLKNKASRMRGKGVNVSSRGKLVRSRSQLLPDSAKDTTVTGRLSVSMPEKATVLGELRSYVPSDDEAANEATAREGESSNPEPDKLASKPLPKRTLKKHGGSTKLLPTKKFSPPSSRDTLASTHSPGGVDGEEVSPTTDVPTGRQRARMLRERAASTYLPDITPMEMEVVQSLRVGGDLGADYQKGDDGAEPRLPGQISPNEKRPPPLPGYVQRRRLRVPSTISYIASEPQSRDVEPKPAGGFTDVEPGNEKTPSLHVSTAGLSGDRASPRRHGSPRRNAVTAARSSPKNKTQLSPLLLPASKSPRGEGSSSPHPPPIPHWHLAKRGAKIAPLPPSSRKSQLAVDPHDTIVGFYMRRISEFLKARHNPKLIPEGYLNSLHKKFPHIGYQVYKAPAAGTLAFLAGQFAKLETGDSLVEIRSPSDDNPINTRANRPVCIGRWLVDLHTKEVDKDQELFELLCVSTEKVPLVVEEYEKEAASAKPAHRRLPRLSMKGVTPYKQYTVVPSIDEDGQSEEDSTVYETSKHEQDDDKKSGQREKKKFRDISELHKAMLKYRDDYGEDGYLKALNADYSNIDYELFEAGCDGTEILECTAESFVPINCDMLIMKTRGLGNTNTMYGAEEYVIGRCFAVKDKELMRGGRLYEVLGVKGIQEKHFLPSYKDDPPSPPKKPAGDWLRTSFAIGKTLLQSSSKDTPKSKPATLKTPRSAKSEKSSTLTTALKSIVFGSRDSGTHKGPGSSALTPPRSSENSSSSKTSSSLPSSRTPAPSLARGRGPSLRRASTTRKSFDMHELDDNTGSTTVRAAPRSRRKSEG